MSGGRFTRHRGPVTSVAGLPGSRRALVGGYDSAVSLVDLAHGSFQLLGYHDHLVNFVTVSSDGRLGASCSSDYSTFIWDLGSGVPVSRLFGHDDDVEGFCFIDATTGVSVSRDHNLILWDVTTGTAVRTFVGHEKDALSVAYHGGVLFSSSDDMTLRMWDVHTGAETGRWGPFEVEVDTCAVDHRIGRVLLGGDDGKIRIFNIADGRLVAELAAHSSGIKKVATEPNGSRVSIFRLRPASPAVGRRHARRPKGAAAFPQRVGAVADVLAQRVPHPRRHLRRDGGRLVAGW